MDAAGSRLRQPSRACSPERSSERRLLLEQLRIELVRKQDAAVAKMHDAIEHRLASIRRELHLEMADVEQKVVQLVQVAHDAVGAEAKARESFTQEIKRTQDQGRMDASLIRAHADKLVFSVTELLCKLEHEVLVKDKRSPSRSEEPNDEIVVPWWALRGGRASPVESLQRSVERFRACSLTASSEQDCESVVALTRRQRTAKSATPRERRELQLQTPQPPPPARQPPPQTPGGARQQGQVASGGDRMSLSQFLSDDASLQGPQTVASPQCAPSRQQHSALPPPQTPQALHASPTSPALSQLSQPGDGSSIASPANEGSSSSGHPSGTQSALVATPPVSAVQRTRIPSPRIRSPRKEEVLAEGRQPPSPSLREAKASVRALRARFERSGSPPAPETRIPMPRRVTSPTSPAQAVQFVAEELVVESSPPTQQPTAQQNWQSGSVAASAPATDEGQPVAGAVAVSPEHQCMCKASQ